MATEELSDSVGQTPKTKMNSNEDEKAVMSKVIEEYRINLPIYRYRSELLQTVERKKFIIIAGEAFGKTSQIPQYLHEAGYTMRGNVVCIHPRRSVVVSTAARVAQEMGVKLGDEVGYSTRFGDCLSEEKTFLIYMTDAMLLNEILNKPDLEGYSTVMVDAADERTAASDVLFGVLRNIARRNVSLKLLVASSTEENAEKLSAYFSKAPILNISGRRYDGGQEVPPLNLEKKALFELQCMKIAKMVLLTPPPGGLLHDMIKFDYADPPPLEVLMGSLEQLYALSAINRMGKVTETGLRMAQLNQAAINDHLDRAAKWRVLKMIVTSDEYKCSAEVITIAAMLLSVKNLNIFNNASFHANAVSDHIALLNMYNSWKQTGFSKRWCSRNRIQVSSMEKARHVRDELESLLARGGFEITSNFNDSDSITKAITSGFFTNSARLQDDGSYRTLRNNQTVQLHPSSALTQVHPRFVIYHELALTKERYMTVVTQVNADWLVDLAPQYFK